MWRVRMMRVMWMVRMMRVMRVVRMMRMVAVRNVAVRIVAVRNVAVRRVAVHGPVRMVVVHGIVRMVVVRRRVVVRAKEFAAAACAHAERRGAGGTFGVGIGGSDGGGLDEQGCA